MNDNAARLCAVCLCMSGRNEVGVVFVGSFAEKLAFIVIAALVKVPLAAAAAVGVCFGGVLSIGLQQCVHCSAPLACLVAVVVVVPGWRRHLVDTPFFPLMFVRGWCVYLSCTSGASQRCCNSCTVGCGCRIVFC